MLGREIAVLINKIKDKGKYEIEFDAGKYSLSCGVYIYQLQKGNKLLSGKFVFIK